MQPSVVEVYFFPSDTFSTKNEVRLASKLVKKRLTKLKFNCTENVASLKLGLSR